MDGHTESVERQAGENGSVLPPGVAAAPNGWELNVWPTYQQVALQFSSEEALDALIDLFWSEPRLQAMPRVYVGDNTVIVPASVVEELRSKGHKFTVQKVISAGDLPAEEVNRLRRLEDIP